MPTPAKRGPGRPPKPKPEFSVNIPTGDKPETITPVDINAAGVGFDTPVGETPPPTEPVVEKRGPGRPRGSRKIVPLEVSGLEQLLFGIHQTLSFATQIPELALHEKEAHAIAESWAEAAKHYEFLNLDPKYAAMMNFGTTVCVIYGSHFANWRMRKAQERPQRTRPVPRQEPIAEPQRPPMNAGQMNGAPAPETPKPPSMSREMMVGEIPGVGAIQFPTDHPLVKGKAN
jgi:hypothetical protein